MNIIIIGCGKVGATLAEQLSAENHNIVIVDTDESKLEAVSSAYDVMTLTGNGASFNVQQEAGIKNADLLIAVTDSDELNLLCCVIAKKGGRCNTIARVRNSLYSKEIGVIKRQLGISMIINPELAAAMEISKILRFPSAIKIDTFAKGRAELMKFKLKPEFGLGGMSVQDISEKMKCNILICGVEREDGAYIPNGNFILQDNDSVSIMASPKDTAEFFRKIGVVTHRVKTALIIGGGKVGYYLAVQLLEMGIRVRIIEKDKARCEQLCELLPKATIICGDGTDQELLMEEGLPYAQSVISVTGLDEENLLLSLFAMKHSSAKVIAKVNHIAFNDIIGGLDFGSVIYPKYLTANKIIKYVRGAQNSMGSNVETLYKILDNQAEALEFSIRQESAVTQTPLMDLNLKDRLLVCCINRNGQIIIPRGQDYILPGDTVIVVTTQKGLRDISDILKK